MPQCRLFVSFFASCTVLLLTGCDSGIADLGPGSGIFNSDPTSGHIAQYVGTDGTVLDFWGWHDDRGQLMFASFVRARFTDGTEVHLRRDELGRIIYFRDRAGDSMRVNSYLVGNSVDVTFITRDDESRRVVIQLSSSTSSQSSGSGPTGASKVVSSPNAQLSSSDLSDTCMATRNLGNTICDLLTLASILKLSYCALTVINPAALLTCVGASTIANYAAEQLLESVLCGVAAESATLPCNVWVKATSLEERIPLESVAPLVPGIALPVCETPADCRRLICLETCIQSFPSDPCTEADCVSGRCVASPIVCPQGDVCVDGECRTPEACQAGEKACGGSCIPESATCCGQGSLFCSSSFPICYVERESCCAASSPLLCPNDDVCRASLSNCPGPGAPPAAGQCTGFSGSNACGPCNTDADCPSGGCWTGNPPAPFCG